MGNNIVNLYPQYDVPKQDNSACVNPFVKNHLNSVTNYKKLNNDLNKIQSGVDVFIKRINNTEKSISNNPLQMLFTGLLNIIPATRRLAPIEDNEKQSNRFKAVGLGLLALINLKEDFRDLMSVFGKTKNELDKEYKAVFKFFAGTPVEAFLMKSETGRNFFHKEDIALADTMFGEKIKDCLGVSEKLKTFPKEIYYPFSKKPEIIKREYVKISGSLFAKVITLSLNRITKLGLIFAVILELPKLIDEITKQNYKQIPKSFLNICCYTVCGALASSIGAYTLGAAGSVLGLGIGYYMGNNISKHVNSKY